MEWNYLITLIISIITVSNILLAGIVIFIERRDIGSTWAWLMVLFFIPVFGFFIYIFLGRQFRQKNFYKLSAGEIAFLKSAADEQLESLKTNTFHHSDLFLEYKELIKMNLRSSNAMVTTDNEIEIFTDGKSKFQSLFKDIRSANKEINIQYYIIQRDALGVKLKDELTKKAREGVKVRLLYDEIGSRSISKAFFKELILEGGEVEVFFPSILKLFNFRINNRNHRKLCIIDGEIAYIGGFNVGEEYLGLDKDLGFWRDTHLRIKGGAVQHLQWRFILDWKQAAAVEKKVSREQFVFRTEKHEGSSPVQIVASGPNSMTENLKNMYIKLIMSAKKSVFIQTPYFIPDTSFMDACKMALLSEVDVRIMIPSKPDHPFVYWATSAYVGELLAYGAKVFIYQKGFLHAKTIVVDQEVTSVGTTNIDRRSFRLNFEMNAIVYDEKVALQLHHLFLHDSQDCVELTLEGYNHRPIQIRFKESLSRLLSPIL